LIDPPTGAGAEWHLLTFLEAGITCGRAAFTPQTPTPCRAADNQARLVSTAISEDAQSGFVKYDPHVSYFAYAQTMAFSVPLAFVVDVATFWGDDRLEGALAWATAQHRLQTPKLDNKNNHLKFSGSPAHATFKPLDFESEFRFLV
jgi:hypothetical protein